jgi:hypothetical protein
MLRVKSHFMSKVFPLDFGNPRDFSPHRICSHDFSKTLLYPPTRIDNMLSLSDVYHFCVTIYTYFFVSDKMASVRRPCIFCILQ